MNVFEEKSEREIAPQRIFFRENFLGFGRFSCCFLFEFAKLAMLETNASLNYSLNAIA